MIMKMKVVQFLTQSNIDHTVGQRRGERATTKLNGADIIIASNPYLAEIRLRLNKHVVGVRNILSPRISNSCWGD